MVQTGEKKNKKLEQLDQTSTLLSRTHKCRCRKSTATSILTASWGESGPTAQNHQHFLQNNAPPSHHGCAASLGPSSAFRCEMDLWHMDKIQWQTWNLRPPPQQTPAAAEREKSGFRWQNFILKKEIGGGRSCRDGEVFTIVPQGTKVG